MLIDLISPTHSLTHSLTNRNSLHMLIALSASASGVLRRDYAAESLLHLCCSHYSHSQRSVRRAGTGWSAKVAQVFLASRERVHCRSPGQDRKECEEKQTEGRSVD